MLYILHTYYIYYITRAYQYTVKGDACCTCIINDDIYLINNEGYNNIYFFYSTRRRVVQNVDIFFKIHIISAAVFFKCPYHYM